MLDDGDRGVIIQRDRETYAVAPHLPCGMVTPKILRKVADVAEKYNVQAVKVTSAARIALIGIKEEDDPLGSAWRAEIDAIFRVNKGVVRTPCLTTPYEVPEAGLEPALSCENWILSPARLPFRHSGWFRLHRYYRFRSARWQAAHALFPDKTRTACAGTSSVLISAGVRSVTVFLLSRYAMTRVDCPRRSAS